MAVPVIDRGREVERARRDVDGEGVLEGVAQVFRLDDRDGVATRVVEVDVEVGAEDLAGEAARGACVGGARGGGEGQNREHGHEPARCPHRRERTPMGRVDRSPIGR